MLRLAILLAIIATAASAQGLEESQGGRTYVVAFPDTVGTTFDARHPSPLRDTFALHLYSDVDNVCTIAGSHGYRRELALAAGTFTTVWLDDADHPSTRVMVREIGTPSRSTFRIDAREPILVVAYMATKYGAEAWLPLPVERWGREYVAMAMPGDVTYDAGSAGSYDYVRRAKMAPAQILVVAAFDSTRVRIERPRATPLHPRPDDTTTVLMAGEAHLFRTLVDTLTANLGIAQPDVTGVRVVASKPIGVASGNTRWASRYDYFGLTGNAFSNILFEWLVPTEQYGTEFVSMPAWDSRLYTGLPGEDPSNCRRATIVCVVGAHGHAPEVTRLSRNGSVYEPPVFDAPRYTNLLRGVHAEVLRTVAPAQAYVVGEQVLQYDGGTFDTASYRAVNYKTWSPWMVTAVPRQQWASFAPIVTPSYPDSMEHVVMVVADSVSARDITWGDGTRFELTRRIEETEYRWGSATLEAGRSYAIVGRNGARFSGSVHGIRRGGEGYDPTKYPEPAHYLETVALSYGYPLAPARRQLRTPTGLDLESAPSIARLEVGASTESGSTTLRAVLPIAGRLRIVLVDMLGRTVATAYEGEADAGTLPVACAVASGAYIVRATVGHHHASVVIVVP